MSILPISIFYAYAQEDEALQKELGKHLSLLKRQGVVAGWHFRMISGGKEWQGEIDSHINKSKMILLLVSPDFLSSDYCYDVEMKKAIELHNSKAARVIPVILRPVDWHSAPFGKLQALPKDGKPITTWTNRDEAFLNVAQGIRQVCRELQEAEGSDSGLPSTAIQGMKETQEHRRTNVYCSRCGAKAGEKSYCTGLYTSHDFRSYSGDVYCTRCGAKAGERSTCTGLYTSHNFKSYSGDVYCTRCGAKAGEKSYCTGIYTSHNFELYSGDVYCTRCGAKAGGRSTCTGLYTSHNFKSY